jgi:hypothetical protein
MNKLRTLLLAALAVCLAVAIACGGGDDDEGDDASGSPSADATSAPTGPPPAAALESVRYTLDFSSEIDGDPGQTFAIAGTYVAPGSHAYARTGDGAEEVVVIGSQVWARVPGGAWTSGTTADLVEEGLIFSSLNDEFFENYPTFLGRLVEKEGDTEDLDGVSVTRYELDEDDDREFQRVFGYEQDELIGGESVDITIWIDNASGHLRRAVFDANGADPDDEDTTLELHFELNATDVNSESIVIEPPI